MRYVFDTEVILKFYLREEGAEVVKKRLQKIADERDEGYMNLVNFAEFYYIVYRKSPSAAEEKLNTLINFGIKPMDVEENWKIAAKIRAEKGVPLGDAFAAATAINLDAVLLAGEDNDFADLRIKVERI